MWDLQPFYMDQTLLGNTVVATGHSTHFQVDSTNSTIVTL
jgi:hypothetical protein